jgi:hypothetical protein
MEEQNNSLLLLTGERKLREAKKRLYPQAHRHF